MSRAGSNGKDQDLPVDEGPLEQPDAASPEAPAATDESGLAAAGPVRDDVDALRRERDELKDALLRRRAEFDNYRKRVERDQGVAAADAAAEVLRRLVVTVDNLERALSSEGGAEALRQGVELTLRDLRAAFEALGVVALDPLDQRFDPLQHQALLHEHVPGFAEGTVAGVFRKGYTYGDRLLRPALVKVASGAPDGDGETGDTGGGGDVH
jgi:molecular chaperone GrpE